MDERPNILWYCTDQQRWDTIAALGNKHIRTPTIDRLVERGVAFERAYCQSPICTPSRATMLTGRYPAAHQVHRNGNDYFPHGETLVTRILADAGYDCGLAGKLHLSRAKDRVERRSDDGYRVFHWSHHPNPDWPEGHAYADWLVREKGVDPLELYGSLSGAVCTGVPAELHQTTWCSDMAVRFITEKRDGPWLMSLNPFDPHPPFDPPKEYIDRFDPSTLPLPAFRESDVEHQRAFADIDQQTLHAVDPRRTSAPSDATRSVTRGDLGSVPPSGYDPRQVKAYYYAMIELIDDQLGRIIDLLEETGQLDNTIIIFTSDHGELLGDHGLIYKGCRFYEALTHIPLVISWPRRIRQGLRSSALVELVDLPETLLAAAGLPVPETMQGRSLMPILTGDEDPGKHKPYVVCEYFDAVDLPRGTHGSMVFDGRYKSIVYHGDDLGEIYDLENDPGELNDLWNDTGSRGLRCRLLRRHLDAMMGATSPGVPRTGSY